jgi:hypothetical protein
LKLRCNSNKQKFLRMIRDQQPNTPIVIIQTHRFNEEILGALVAKNNPDASIHTFPDAKSTRAGMELLMKRAGSVRPGVLVTQATPMQEVGMLPSESLSLQEHVRLGPDLHNLMEDMAWETRNRGWHGVMSSHFTPDETRLIFKRHGLYLPKAITIIGYSERGLLMPADNLGEVVKDLLDSGYRSIARSSVRRDENTPPPTSLAS